MGGYQPALGIAGMLIDRYPRDYRGNALASKAFLARGEVSSSLAMLQEGIKLAPPQQQRSLGFINSLTCRCIV